MHAASARYTVLACRPPAATPVAPVVSNSQAQQPQARPRVQLPSLQQVHRIPIISCKVFVDVLMQKKLSLLQMLACSTTQISTCVPGASCSAITVWADFIPALHFCTKLLSSDSCQQQCQQLGNYKQTRCQSTKNCFTVSPRVWCVCLTKRHRPATVCRHKQSTACCLLTRPQQASKHKPFLTS